MFSAAFYRGRFVREGEFMSQCFHVWYAHPLPWDAESGQAHWQQTRDSGVHEPRLVRCVERLHVLLQAYEPDTIWSEEPEANAPCAALSLAPMTGSLELVAEAIAKAAAEQGLCVFNPFDATVWLPDGRVLQRLGIALAEPTPPAPTAQPPAEEDAAAQALRGDGPLGAYLLTQWAPLLRQAGFKVRSRPSSEFPWCVFTGKVLRVHVHCTVRRSRLTVSVTLSPGGKAMPACLQTEFGVGSIWMDLVALARWGGLPVVPEVERDDFFTELHRTGGDPARLAAQWRDLFGVLVRWLQPLDDVAAFAQAVQDPAAPLRQMPAHPIEGMMLFAYVPHALAVLAQQPGALLAACRRMALADGTGWHRNKLRELLPPLPAPTHAAQTSAQPGVEELVVWQGPPDATAPLDVLAQLRQSLSPPVNPAPLQQWLDTALLICPAPDTHAAPGPWAEPPATSVSKPWLRLAFAIDDDGKVRGATSAQQAVVPRLRIKALQMGLTVYHPPSQCVWTPDDRLHTPWGSISLKPELPPPLLENQSVSHAQAFYAAHDAVAPLAQRHGFVTGQGCDVFCKTDALGIWRICAPLSSLGDEGLLFSFEPHRPPSPARPSRHFSAKGAGALLAQLSGQTRPEAPAAVQLVGTSAQRLQRALQRVQTLWADSVADLLRWLDDPAHCQAWVESTDR